MKPWHAQVAEALVNKPHPKKIYWFHGLHQFQGWQLFVQCLVKRHNAISFTHRSRTSVALRYTGQRIVIFSLEGVAAGDDVEHVFENIRKLKEGVIFCTLHGVKTFAPPHVLVFAEFPVPGKKAEQAVKVEKVEQAEQAVKVEQAEQAVKVEQAEQAVKVEKVEV
jgi:hypothetical protein